jgi:hypothetical protein
LIEWWRSHAQVKDNRYEIYPLIALFFSVLTRNRVPTQTTQTTQYTVPFGVKTLLLNISGIISWKYPQNHTKWKLQVKTRLLNNL